MPRLCIRRISEAGYRDYRLSEIKPPEASIRSVRNPCLAGAQATSISLIFGVDETHLPVPMLGRNRPTERV